LIVDNSIFSDFYSKFMEKNGNFWAEVEVSSRVKTMQYPGGYFRFIFVFMYFCRLEKQQV